MRPSVSRGSRFGLGTWRFSASSRASEEPPGSPWPPNLYSDRLFEASF
jgi:hypothetical protein